MKIKKSVVFILLCIIVTAGIGWLVCENQVLKTSSEYRTYNFGLEDVLLQNIKRTENGLVTEEDPQVIMQRVNSYVDDIYFEGIVIKEEMQVFYTDLSGELFSEEKSIMVQPEQLRDGSRIKLGRTVYDLRVDFNGEQGSTYALEKIVLNPPVYVEWGFGVCCICIFVGLILGVCLLFVLTEGKRIPIYMQALKKYRFLLEDMVVRDIKLKYRRSVIGLLWSILNPLLMMIVITAVFQNLFRFEIENFSVYYLTGWVIYNFMIEATSGAMASIIGASALIRKVYIPKYIFPMQKCIFSFVNMIFSLVAVLVVMLVLKVKFTWYILLIPIPLILALVFAVGLGMILATVAVFFRDMIHLYSVFTMVWMYLTPIIYPEEILVGAMKTIMKLNPLYYYVDCFRQLTLYGNPLSVESCAVMCVCSAVSLLLGVAVFKKKQDRFILFI